MCPRDYDAEIETYAGSPYEDYVAITTADTAENQDLAREDFLRDVGEATNAY